MDPTEDLSARILLKRILVTEPPRTPVTRSENREQSSSALRRSARLSNADAQTPQSLLRRSLRQNIREKITRKSLPATKRRTPVVVVKKRQTAAVSDIFSDEGTPRCLLRNILQTEPVKSPVVHENRPSQEQDPPPADKTVTRTRFSGLSDLDLSDVTISHAASTAKGLSRKRPRRSLNVTAFEKRLKDKDDAEEEADNVTGDHSSMSLSSSTSLSLKTPFVDIQTEKRGLLRRVSNRRKITQEEFGAAVNRREMGVMRSYAQVERDLSETTHSEGFTLGLSKLSEPDITMDIVHCSTALYDLSDATTSNLPNVVATQDKSTVMASHLQAEMQEMEEVEEEEQRKLDTEMSDKEHPAEPQNNECIFEAQLQEDVDESEPPNRKDRNQQEHAALTSTSEEEGEAVLSQIIDADDRAEFEKVEAQTEEESAPDSNMEEGVEEKGESEAEQVALDSQTEEEEGSDASQMENGAADSQSEDIEADFQSNKQDISPDSQKEEEEGSDASEMENDKADSETVETGSQSDEEEVALDSESKEDEQEEGAEDLQSEDFAAESQCEDVEKESQSEEDNVAKSQSEDDDCEEEEELVSGKLEHISRRAYRSEGALVPITEAGEKPAKTRWSVSTSKAHVSVDLNTSLERRNQRSSQLCTGKPDATELSGEELEDVSCPENDPEDGKENLLPHLQVTEDDGVGGHLGDLLPEDIPAEDTEKEEEEEDDSDDDDLEDEESLLKTPPFVKEKRTFFLPDPQKSPVFRNTQAGSSTEAAAKPKQVRQRRAKPSVKEKVLPKTYLMSVFKHFAKTKVSKDVYPVLNEIMDTFFTRMAADLETYANHAKRKTINIEDTILLLKRQGYVNDKVPVEVLIEKYLRMEQRKLLIPIATSGNVVIPKKRL